VINCGTTFSPSLNQLKPDVESDVEQVARCLTPTPHGVGPTCECGSADDQHSDPRRGCCSPPPPGSAPQARTGDGHLMHQGLLLITGGYPAVGAIRVPYNWADCDEAHLQALKLCLCGPANSRCDSPRREGQPPPYFVPQNPWRTCETEGGKRCSGGAINLFQQASQQG
jgi:hypothetical protein